MKEQSQQVIPEINAKEFIVIEEKDGINETVTELSKISCQGNCASGVGKSYLCVKLTEFLGDEKYQALCFTNVACDNLRKQGVKNVQTLDSFFNYHSKEGKLKQSITHLIIDEVSMVNSYHMSLVMKMKKKYGVKLIMFGYFNQYRPIEDNSYDYLNNQIFREMIDYNLLLMKYKSLSRFQGETLKIVNKLLDRDFDYENKNEYDFQETNGIDLTVRHHITLVNKRKDKINKTIVESNYGKYFNDVNVSIGLYYICRENQKETQLFNWQLFEVIKFEAGKLTMVWY